MTTGSTAPQADTAPAPHHAPRWVGGLVWLALLAALLAVFGLYMQPDFLLTLADQVWSCL